MLVKEKKKIKSSCIATLAGTHYRGTFQYLQGAFMDADPINSEMLTDVV